MVTERQIKLARDKFKEISGITIYTPDEGTLDDFEQSRYDGLVAALEAALSAAEPVGWQWRNPRWTVGDQWQHCPDGPREDKLPGTEYRPVYAAPPAPSVAVKALTDAYKAGFDASSQGYNGEVFPEYEADNEWLAQRDSDLSALSAQVQDVAESKQLELNVTKEWFEKRAALEGDLEIGAGRRKLTACIDPTPDELAELYRIAHRIPEGWQLVPTEPTKEMCEAAPSLPSIHAVDDLPLNKAGWSMKAIQNLKRYRAMLAAAPAKQEG